MSIPPPEVEREKIHTRTLTVEGYKRADGLWDIEGTLTDVKTRDFAFHIVPVASGKPIHAMRLRITIDAAFTIHAAHAVSEAVPYPGICNTIAPDYSQLQGLQIKAGFRRKVMALFGSTRGCTHITDLIFTVATGAIQSLAGQIAQDDNDKPFQLDGCHALDRSSPVVAHYHPRWYRKKTG